MIQTVKAISLWEPWATLVRLKAKLFETRSWKRSYKGPLLICASTKVVPLYMVEHLLCNPVFWEVLRPLGIPAVLYQGFGKFECTPKSWKTIVDHYLFPGKAVALANLVSYHATQTLYLSEQEKLFGDYSPGRFAWRLDDITPIVPVPVTGKQGLFDATVDIQIEGE